MSHKVTSIEFPFSESGWFQLCHSQGITVKTWAEANQILRELRSHFVDPELGGYDKTDFVITFEDGTVYKGRYDVHPNDTELLERHVTNHCSIYAGRLVPPHLIRRVGEDRAKQTIARSIEVAGPDHVQFCQFILDQCILHD